MKNPGRQPDVDPDLLAIITKATHELSQAAIRRVSDDKAAIFSPEHNQYFIVVSSDFNCSV